MPDFTRARSGLLAGVILGALATALFGLGMLAAIADVVQSVLLPRSVSFTSIIFGVVCLVGTTLFALMGFSSFRMLVRWQRINDQPVLAWGTLGDPRQTTTRINRRRLFDFPVMVTPPQGPPYEAVARWFYPTELREIIRANARVVVRVDPDNVKTVLIDWDQTREALGLPRASD